MSISSLAALTGSEQQIVDAIASASRTSPISFNYLLATARRESGLSSSAKSTTSSASGLYQFVSQTWLATLKAHGAEHGYGAYADAITRMPGGGYTVSDPALKGEILALRQDPTAAATMAAALAEDNAKSLEAQLFRAPSEGEIYAAHVLGASGAARLIAAAAQSPDVGADTLFPEAAAANRGLFYDRATGQPVTVGALYARLTGTADTPTTLLASAGASPTGSVALSPSPRVAMSFGTDALVVLNAIQPRSALMLLPDDDKDKNKQNTSRTARPVTSA